MVVSSNQWKDNSSIWKLYNSYEICECTRIADMFASLTYLSHWPMKYNIVVSTHNYDLVGYCVFNNFQIYIETPKALTVLLLPGRDSRLCE